MFELENGTNYTQGREKSAGNSLTAYSPQKNNLFKKGSMTFISSSQIMGDSVNSQTAYGGG